jgi:hypothetical protein
MESVAEYLKKSHKMSSGVASRTGRFAWSHIYIPMEITVKGDKLQIK